MSGVTMPGMRWAVFRFAFASPIFWLWALTMDKNASFSVRPAAALLLPLTLLAAPAFAQTAVKEASEIGRASCRERVCQLGVDLGGRRIIKKKTTEKM